MADILTEAQLTTFLPTLTGVPGWTAALNAAMDRFEINTPWRGAAFLAQVAHESGEFTHLIENLNYSASRLCSVWPNRFATLQAAAPYERNPQALANFVYAKRLGNGDSRAATAGGFADAASFNSQAAATLDRAALP